MTAAAKTVLTAQEMARTLARMAHEITEKNPDCSQIILAGISTRGVPLARRLADKIKTITGVDVPCGSLDITFYRDDIQSKGPDLNAGRTDISHDINGKTLILVDDVLFAGRSIRAAIDAVMDIGRPGRIQLAVLLDRGHRELPIRPDYIGKNIPTARGERVRVKLSETDGEDLASVVENA